jgi:hypothetical protein
MNKLIVTSFEWVLPTLSSIAALALIFTISCGGAEDPETEQRAETEQPTEVPGKGDTSAACRDACRGLYNGHGSIAQYQNCLSGCHVVNMSTPY